MMTLVNSQIAKKLGLNKATIGNYIQDAIEGKNSLQTIKVNEKVKLVDSPHNWLELGRLAEVGKKYRPSSAQKSVTVPEKFYTLFDDESQFEIIRDLEIEKQIDLKYYYYKEGAAVWNQAIDSKVSFITLEVEELLRKSLGLICGHFNNHKYNLIDIGCGNGQPADLIIEQKQVASYIACDISPDILQNCKQFIHSKFPNQQIETSHFDFQKVSLETHFKSWTNKNPNLFMFAGNTICNHTKHDRYYLLNSITRAMDKHDLFLITYTLDTDKNKSSLSYVRNMLNYWLPSLLGIDTEKVETEVRYNHETKCKELNILLDKAYVMNFQVQNQDKVIKLDQSEKINLWKHYVFSLNEIIDELKDAGLQLSFSVATNDNVLIGCRLALK